MREQCPLFILGTQRSGTTLLCRMLSSHPLLYVQNELNVRKIFTADATKKSIVGNIKQLIKDDQGLSLEEIMARDGKRYWGLKDPELTDHIASLEGFVSDTKFIIIIRDPRAVVNSYMENKWGLGTNAYSGVLRWVSEVESQLQFKK